MFWLPRPGLKTWSQSRSQIPFLCQGNQEKTSKRQGCVDGHTHHIAVCSLILMGPHWSYIQSGFLASRHQRRVCTLGCRKASWEWHWFSGLSPVNWWVQCCSKWDLGTPTGPWHGKVPHELTPPSSTFFFTTSTTTQLTPSLCSTNKEHLVWGTHKSLHHNKPRMLQRPSILNPESLNHSDAKFV